MNEWESEYYKGNEDYKGNGEHNNEGNDEYVERGISKWKQSVEKTLDDISKLKVQESVDLMNGKFDTQSLENREINK